MTTTHHTLVDGTFAPPEAAQILLALVKSKIDYHHLEKLSNEERFGRDVAHSERRLTELRELHETLRTLCREAGAAGVHLRLSGSLVIEPVPAPVPV